MAKREQSTKRQKRAQRQDRNFDPRFRRETDNVVPFEPNRRQRAPGVQANVDEPKKIVYRSPNQKLYGNTIKANVVTFGLGPAGTGKTHVAVTLGAEAYLAGTYGQIIISRPAQGMEDEDMGFLPGTIAEKFEPWFRPVRVILDKYFGANRVDSMLENEQIVICPLNYISGLTFENAWVVVDEAQNVSKKTMKRILTRIGTDCKMILNGDTDQVDIDGISGLAYAKACLTEGAIPAADVGAFTFDIEDVIRHPVVKEVLKRWKD